MQVQIATCQFSLYSNCKCTSSKIAGMMDDSFDKNLSKLAIAGFIQHKSFLASYCWIQSTKNVSSTGIFHMVSHSLSLCCYLFQTCTSWMDGYTSIGWPAPAYLRCCLSQLMQMLIFFGSQSTPLHSVQPILICLSKRRTNLTVACPPYE